MSRDARMRNPFMAERTLVSRHDWTSGTAASSSSRRRRSSSSSSSTGSHRGGSVTPYYTTTATATATTTTTTDDDNYCYDYMPVRGVERGEEAIALVVKAPPVPRISNQPLHRNLQSERGHESTMHVLVFACSAGNPKAPV